MDRWGLIDRYDVYAPCVFFGIQDSYKAINKHKGVRILLSAGPGDNIDWSKIKFTKNLNLTCVISPEDIMEPEHPMHVKVKHFLPEIKNFIDFKPFPSGPRVSPSNVLGNKIYFYQQIPEFKDDIDYIQKHIDWEIITTQHTRGSDYYSVAKLKKDYYEKSFVHLNFRKDAAMTTVTELGHMGRKTIMNTRLYNNTFGDELINYKTLKKPSFNWRYDSLVNCDDVIRLIKKEAKKIGTWQKPIEYNILKTNEWLNVEYWFPPKASLHEDNFRKINTTIPSKVKDSNMYIHRRRK